MTKSATTKRQQRSTPAQRPTPTRSWGPVDDLVEQLCRLNGHEASPAAGLVVAVRGLWTLAVAIGLRPNQSKAESGEQISQGSASRDLAECLTRCQTWIGHRNLEWCLPWFHPFRNDLPAELAGVSEKSVAWTLMTFAIAQSGPAAIRHPEQFRTSMKPFRVDRNGVCLADALCLHIQLERLTAMAGHSSQLSFPNQASGRERFRRGGLRSGRFLRNWRSLLMLAEDRNHPSHDKAVTWFSLLESLVAMSPLTQWIYPDLFTPVTNLSQLYSTDIPAVAERFAAVPGVPMESTTVNAGRSFQISSLDSFQELDDAAAGAADQFQWTDPTDTPSDPAGDNEPQRGWRLIWVTLLVRSLVAAVRSPSPLEDQLNDRERQGENAEQNEDFRQLREQVFHQRLNRFVFLRALTGAPVDRSAESDVRSQAMKSCLRMRFLDMLIRNLASEQMNQIEAQFRSSTETTDARRRDAALRSGDSVLFQTFVKTLTGYLPEPLVSELAQHGTQPDMISWFQLQWAALLELPVRPGAEADREADSDFLLKNCLLPELAVTQLINRFCNDDRHGVEVSFQGRCPQTWAPAGLLESWTSVMTSQLIREQSEDEEVTVRDV